MELKEKEAKLYQAYKMRAAFHRIPSQARELKYTKWLDEEVTLCEKEAGFKGTSNALRTYFLNSSHPKGSYE